MKAGLIYEIESVKPHAADHEYRVFWETMAQIELADRLGYDYAADVGTRSAAVIVWLPAVTRLKALVKVWTPESAAVNV